MRTYLPIPLIFLVLSSSLLRFSTAAFAPRGSPISFLTTSLPPASAPQSSSLITAPTSPGLLATTLFTDSKATFPVSSVDNALKSLCGHTDFTDLCVDAIKETSPGLTRADNVTVLVTLMLAVEAKAREAKAYALQLAHSSAYDPKSRELLHDCADLIDDALDNLAAAAAAVKAHDDGTRDAVLSAMISNFGTCEDGFQELSMESPMATWSKRLQSMTDNCLAIVNIGKTQDYF